MICKWALKEHVEIFCFKFCGHVSIYIFTIILSNSVKSGHYLFIKSLMNNSHDVIIHICTLTMNLIPDMWSWSWGRSCWLKTTIGWNFFVLQKKYKKLKRIHFLYSKGFLVWIITSKKYNEVFLSYCIKKDFLYFSTGVLCEGQVAFIQGHFIYIFPL